MAPTPRTLQPPRQTVPKKGEVSIKIQDIREKEIKKKKGAGSRIPTI